MIDDRGSEQLSQVAAALVSDALKIIDEHVAVSGPTVQVSDTGSEGAVMRAATYLAKAHSEQPTLPTLHYAYCSALALAMQFAAARDEMESLSQAHPAYPLARWAVRGWETWKSHFMLPDWETSTRSVPRPISDAVIGCTLLAVRDGITPRATLFFRDRAGDFQDLDALRSARIDITMVVDENTTAAPVAGIYGRVWDDPSNALGLEAHGLPLYPYAHPIRRAYEHLTTQRDIDFVVLSMDDRILLNRRLEMPSRMLVANEELVRVLERAEEHSYDQSDVTTAVAAHQQQFNANDVSY